MFERDRAVKATALHRLRSLIRGFSSDGRGTTTVEFAIVSLPFMGLLFALFQTAFLFFATEGVEAAANVAARAVMTGQVQGNSAITTATQFRNAVICNPPAPQVSALPSFMTCANLLVDVRTAGNMGSTSFNSADVAKDFYNNVTMTYCTGGPGDVVVVRLVYPMPAFIPIITGTKLVVTGTNTSGQTSFNGKMTNLLMGAAAFRNEPFPATSANAGCT